MKQKLTHEDYIKGTAAAMAVPNVGTLAMRQNMKPAAAAFHYYKMDLRLELEERLGEYLKTPTSEAKIEIERLLSKIESGFYPEEKWMVVRQDDAGHRFSSHGRLTKEAAEAIAAEMEAKGHKQMYTVEEMTEENMKDLVDAVTFLRHQKMGQ